MNKNIKEELPLLKISNEFIKKYEQAEDDCLVGAIDSIKEVQNICTAEAISTGHKSISTDEYKVAGRNLNLTSNLTIKHPTYIEQKPYVDDTGIYVPLEPYVKEGDASYYKCVMTKEMFVEACNKWIKNE